VPRARAFLALTCALGLLFASLGFGAARVVLEAGGGSTALAGVTCVDPVCVPGPSTASCIGGGALATGSVLVLVLAGGLAVLGLVRVGPLTRPRRASLRFALPRGRGAPVFRPPRAS
jgi:hypothetical protein